MSRTGNACVGLTWHSPLQFCPGLRACTDLSEQLQRPPAGPRPSGLCPAHRTHCLSPLLLIPVNARYGLVCGTVLAASCKFRNVLRTQLRPTGDLRDPETAAEWRTHHTSAHWCPWCTAQYRLRTGGGPFEHEELQGLWAWAAWRGQWAGGHLGNSVEGLQARQALLSCAKQRRLLSSSRPQLRGLGSRHCQPLALRSMPDQRCHRKAVTHCKDGL